MAVKKTDRATIVAKAGYLFRVKGYHNTSMKDIGEACNLLKGSIYHYFPGKEELAASVLEELTRYFEENIFRPLREDPGLPEIRMAQYNRAVEDFFIGREGGCIMGNFALEIMDVEPNLSLHVKDYFERWARALSVVLVSRYEEERSLALARDYVARTQGAIMMMRVFQDSSPFLEVGRSLMELLNDEKGGGKAGESRA